jgi:hypothetical protein
VEVEQSSNYWKNTLEGLIWKGQDCEQHKKGLGFRTLMCQDPKPRMVPRSWHTRMVEGRLMACL